jgi:hypothetical protein
MGPALPNDDPFDRRATILARFSGSLVNPEVALEFTPAVNPIDACTTVVQSQFKGISDA